MLETKEKEIDGMKIAVTQFPARHGFKIQAKLIRIFGPVIGELVAGAKDEKDVKLSNLGSSIEKLFKALDEDQAEKLVFQLIETTRIGGQEASTDFDNVFAGKYLTLYKIIGFVLEVNYGSFFGKSDIGKVLKNLTKQQPVSQQS